MPDKLLATAPRVMLHAVLHIVWLAASCFGADISFTVSGPTQVQVGRRIHLFVEFKSKDDIPPTLVRFRCVKQSDPNAVIDMDCDPDGKDCYCWADAGLYEIEVEAFVVANAKESKSVTHRLEVQPHGIPPLPKPRPQPVDPQPLPPDNPPGPVPPNPPKPPTPDVVPAGEFGIAPKVADIVRKITDPAKAATGKALADAADAIAAQIAAGTLTGVNDLLTKIGESIKATGNPAWQAAAAEFSKELSAVYESHKRDRLAVSTLGGFKDAAGWSTMMREVAAGVRAGVK
jgi:hypothetical protein